MVAATSLADLTMMILRALSRRTWVPGLNPIFDGGSAAAPSETVRSVIEPRPCADHVEGDIGGHQLGDRGREPGSVARSAWRTRPLPASTTRAGPRRKRNARRQARQRRRQRRRTWLECHAGRLQIGCNIPVDRQIGPAARQATMCSRGDGLLGWSSICAELGRLCNTASSHIPWQEHGKVHPGRPVLLSRQRSDEAVPSLDPRDPRRGRRPDRPQRHPAPADRDASARRRDPGPVPVRLPLRARWPWPLVRLATGRGGSRARIRRSSSSSLAGAAAQILATGLMLAAMRERSFAVVTAIIKTEPVQVAAVRPRCSSATRSRRWSPSRSWSPPLGVVLDVDQARTGLGDAGCGRWSSASWPGPSSPSRRSASEARSSPSRTAPS